MTKGYNLLAKAVIHTVGPVWQGGDRGEAALLKSCYLESLKLAVTHGFKTVAFPSISTGVYGYPKAQAAQIAVQTVTDVVAQGTPLTEVIFCCFSATDLAIYEKLLQGTTDSA